jgi:hypothetical protein
MALITPPEEHHELSHTTSFLLLFGPRRGGDWEIPTAKWFLEREEDLCVASTRSREWSTHLTGVQRRQCIKMQRDWVTMYINLVLDRIINRRHSEARAAILIWCPKEENVDSLRNYAPATRIAIGQITGWINGASGRLIFQSPDQGEFPDGLFIGADEGFGGRRDLEIALELHGRPLYSSLEEMRELTLKYLRGKNEKVDM